MSQCLPCTPWWGGRRTLLIPRIGAGCARPSTLPTVGNHCAVAADPVIEIVVPLGPPDLWTVALS